MATPKSSEMPLSGNFIMSLDENFIKTLIVSYWETLDDFQAMPGELWQSAAQEDRSARGG
jgi:heme-degrading monooxygenase HmoA